MIQFLIVFKEKRNIYYRKIPLEYTTKIQQNAQLNSNRSLCADRTKIPFFSPQIFIVFVLKD